MAPLKTVQGLIQDFFHGVQMELEVKLHRKRAVN